MPKNVIDRIWMAMCWCQRLALCDSRTCPASSRAPLSQRDLAARARSLAPHCLLTSPAQASPNSDSHHVRSAVYADHANDVTPLTLAMLAAHGSEGERVCKCGSHPTSTSLRIEIREGRELMVASSSDCPPLHKPKDSPPAQKTYVVVRPHKLRVQGWRAGLEAFAHG